MPKLEQDSPVLPPPVEGGFNAYDHAAVRCGLAMACLGVLGLAGGLSGHLVWDELFASSVPMALSTAVCFISTGCLLAALPSLVRQPGGGGWAGFFLAAGVVLAGLLNVLEYLFDLGVLFDPLDRGANLLQISLDIRSTPMSPVTGTLFMATGVSLFLLLPPFTLAFRPSRARNFASFLGILVCIAALTFGLGYVFGSPLLYGSGIVPVAFSTSAAFLAAGAGIVCASGPDAAPLKPFSGGSNTARILRGFTPMMALVTLALPILSRLLVTSGVHDALATSALAVTGSCAVLVWVVQIGRSIGDEMDHAETKRNEAELRLRVSEERFRSTFEQTAMGMAHVGPDGRWLQVNQRLCDIVGYTREELLTKTFQDITHPDDLDKDLSLLSELMAGRIPMYSMEKRYFRKDGQVIWVSLTVSMTRTPAGETDYFIAAIEDITAKKATERELEKARGYIKNIINSMPSVVIGVDEHGDITHLNSTAAGQLEAATGNPVGCPLEKVFPAYAGQLEAILRAIRERKSVLVEKEAHPANGEVHYRDVLIYPLVANGVEGAVLRIDDVTERVRLAEMMVQTEKMVSVGGLAAGMAHEINNPLGAILQSSQVILMHLDPSMEANEKAAGEAGCGLDAIRAYLEKRRVFEFLTGIRESAKRAAAIVANMLEFSRKSASGKAPASMAELLDKSVELASSDYDLKKKYDFRHVAINRDYEPDLAPVLCARTEIEQVLLNLLKNAAQAMAGKQYPEGEGPAITLRARQAGNVVVVTVEDNGPGMDESVRKRVFEPFFTTKEPGHGTGLGLSVSYFIVTSNHGGAFSVESEPGRGATFTIELPAADMGRST